MDERIGQVLVETYRIERLIAEGGMAAVYEASHLRIPKRFAVKFMKLGLVNNAEALQRFRREAEIIATLDHPNIVGLVDYNAAEDGTPYIVLEYIDGENLGTRLLRGPLDMRDTMRITDSVAAALQAAHDKGIVHRDLKPENIMLSGVGASTKVKVLDFGVAKLRHGPELTAFNVVVGTVGFMAPEQVSGGAVDARTDQFALANIVYTMLTGQSPFEIDGAITQQALHILHFEPKDLPGVPAAFNAALQRAFRKLPAQRFSSVDEFARSLRVAVGKRDSGELAPLPGLSTVVSAPPEAMAGAPATDPDGVIVHPELTVNGAPTRSIDRSSILPNVGTLTTMELQKIELDADMTEPQGTPLSLSPDPPMTSPTALLSAAATLPPGIVTPGSDGATRPSAVIAPPHATAANGRRVEPFVTPKSLPAVGPDGQPVAGFNAGEPHEETSLTLGKRAAAMIPRAIWIAVGAVCGGSVAALVWFLAR
jgi:serine/threonine protein kinase